MTRKIESNQFFYLCGYATKVQVLIPNVGRDLGFPQMKSLVKIIECTPSSKYKEGDTVSVPNRILYSEHRRGH